MGPSVYLLDTLTTMLCAILLLTGYRRVKSRLLLWSGLCFAGLTISNALVFVDLVILPDVDLYLMRLGVAAVSMALLLYGLIWEAR
jgi:hypothetical protein